MTRIVIVSGNHLCHNPRVVKEATTLAMAGYDVEVLGVWLDPVLKGRDIDLISGAAFRYTPILDLAREGAIAGAERLACRIRSKAGRLAYRHAGWANRWQFGYAAGALARAARQRQADLYVAHSEAGLLVARDLLGDGRRAGVDMEDWFSEDLLPEARTERPVALLRELERDVLRRAVHSTCPSEAMSGALARTYECRPPAVIYNAFPLSDRQSLDGARKDREGRQRPTVHWYSQTIGAGRGIEDLLGALPLVRHDFEVHLRGTPVAGFDAWLAARTPENWRDRVFLHGVVDNRELLSRIAEHDIGFAGEMKYGQNRDLTISNKILHYLLAGLAVVASDTKGQCEVAARAGDAVTLYPSGDCARLAQRLDALLESPAAMQRAKQSALRAAEAHFCWERQEERLLESVSRAIGRA